MTKLGSWTEWCRSVGLKRKTADAIIDQWSLLPLSLVAAFAKPKELTD